MNSSSIRRLAADHASLHTDGLPPNYLFPPSSAASSIPDDLAQLTILLTGPQGTPYSQGVWKLHLKMPEDYPRSPPKAAFRTRIWHPNVEESSGSVCVDTLKRDWETKLTLRDVLVTISCLLINPNPDSALNSAAGSLLQEDYDAFARQAKLMTSIHAAIPSDLKDAVTDAKRRGEEAGTEIREEQEERRPTLRKVSASSTMVMKKRPQIARLGGGGRTESTASVESTSSTRANPSQTSLTARLSQLPPVEGEASDDECNEATANQENDPSLSPSPVSPFPPSPRKNILGKRPLSDLPPPVDPDADDADDICSGERPESSAQNIANNISATYFPSDKQYTTGSSRTPARKSPKLTQKGQGINASGRVRDDIEDRALITPFSDEGATTEQDNIQSLPLSRHELVASEEGKENITEASGAKAKSAMVKPVAELPAVALKASATGRNSSASSKGSVGSGKVGKPRVGLRRL
ncbi:MAG: hypothetical protein M1812_007813 [Candelaria pacifica]|nr:MAG: hypothetical protein M1812_007813 [Candelaria pacifica]